MTEKKSDIVVRLDWNRQVLQGGTLLVSHDGDEHQFRFVDDDSVVEFLEQHAAPHQERLERAVREYTRDAFGYPLDWPGRFKKVSRISKEMYDRLVEEYDTTLAPGPSNKRATRVARYVEDYVNEGTDFVDLWAYQHDDRFFLLRSASPEPKWESVE